MFPIRNRFIRDVLEFRRKFDLVVREKPEFPSRDVVVFRADFAQEEAQETADALHDEDMPKTVDGLVDQIYVAIDTALELGLDLDSHWDLVHRKNMEKIKVPGTLKIQKPEGWTPPDHEPILKRTAERVLDESQNGTVNFALAYHIVNFMNELLRLDPECVRGLVQARVPCNMAISDHPTVQVRAYPEGAPHTVALVGILNGLVGAYADGMGAIGYNQETDGKGTGVVKEFYVRYPTRSISEPEERQ